MLRGRVQVFHEPILGFYAPIGVGMLVYTRSHVGMFSPYIMDFVHRPCRLGEDVLNVVDARRANQRAYVLTKTKMLAVDMKASTTNKESMYCRSRFTFPAYATNRAFASLHPLGTYMLGFSGTHVVAFNVLDDSPVVMFRHQLEADAVYVKRQQSQLRGTDIIAITDKGVEWWDMEYVEVRAPENAGFLHLEPGWGAWLLEVLSESHVPTMLAVAFGMYIMQQKNPERAVPDTPGRGPYMEHSSPKGGKKGHPNSQSSFNSFNE
eukprot:GEMP01032717.1.p1 GENE.GEMP01032717.1~~GEMP01032717.1.p1  ORF type:complete len:264 (+),score=49.46 GEMP01032717.1:434-1225(+)